MMARHIRTSVGEILDLAKQEIFEVEVRVMLYSKGRKGRKIVIKWVPIELHR